MLRSSLVPGEIPGFPVTHLHHFVFDTHLLLKHPDTVTAGTLCNFQVHTFERQKALSFKVLGPRKAEG